MRELKSLGPVSVGGVPLSMPAVVAAPEAKQLGGSAVT